MTKSIFPDPIHDLPKADIPFDGIKAFLSQGFAHQIIFMEFSEDVELPEHNNEGYADITFFDQKDRYKPK